MARTAKKAQKPPAGRGTKRGRKSKEQLSDDQVASRVASTTLFVAHNPKEREDEHFTSEEKARVRKVYLDNQDAVDSILDAFSDFIDTMRKFHDNPQRINEAIQGVVATVLVSNNSFNVLEALEGQNIRADVVVFN